jgi:hypothetical protein
MTTTTYRLPGYLKIANPLIKGLNRLGLSLGTMRVIAVPGRRSGKLRATPVSPLTVEGHRYVIAGLPGSDWAKNARAAGWGLLSRGRRTERVTLTEVIEPSEQPCCGRSRPRCRTEWTSSSRPASRRDRPRTTSSRPPAGARSS